MAAFAAAAACVGAPAAASEVYTLSDGNQEVTVYSISQQEGAALAREYNEITSFEIGSARYYRERKTYIQGKIFEDMITQGYNQNLAQIFARDLATVFSYKASNGNREIIFDENATTPVNGIGPLALRYPKISDNFCAVVSADRNHSASQWLEQMTGFEGTINLPEQYGEMFAEFVNFHESAHCMQMSEPQADYIASLQIMDRYYADQPEMTERFLWMMSGLRNHNAMRSVEFYSKYFMNGTYIHMAMNDYKADPGAFDTDQKIYEHRLNNMPTDLDFIDHIQDTFRRSLAYIESLMAQNMCRVPASEITVSYSSPQCR